MLCVSLVSLVCLADLSYVNEFKLSYNPTNGYIWAASCVTLVSLICLADLSCVNEFKLSFAQSTKWICSGCEPFSIFIGVLRLSFCTLPWATSSIISNFS